jgi:hypothetical protein
LGRKVFSFENKKIMDISPSEEFNLMEKEPNSGGGEDVTG